MGLMLQADGAQRQLHAVTGTGFVPQTRAEFELDDALRLQAEAEAQRVHGLTTKAIVEDDEMRAIAAKFQEEYSESLGLWGGALQAQLKLWGRLPIAVESLQPDVKPIVEIGRRGIKSYPNKVAGFVVESLTSDAELFVGTKPGGERARYIVGAVHAGRPAVRVAIGQ